MAGHIYVNFEQERGTVSMYCIARSYTHTYTAGETAASCFQDYNAFSTGRRGLSST